MAWFQRFAPVAQRSYPLKNLSQDDYERLIYWLASRSGEFDAVHWYRGARASGKGRDVVGVKSTTTGRERWYIQCRRHTRISHSVLRRELDSLADLAAKMPNFVPQAIVFTTIGDIPALVKNRSAIYARALNLPEPRFWGRQRLSEMLNGQPETREEFFGPPRSFVQWIGSYLRPTSVWAGVVVFGLALYIVTRTVSSWSPPARVSREAAPVVVLAPSPTVTVVPTSTPIPTLINTPKRTPSSSPTDTPQPVPAETVTPTYTPTSAPTSTSTPIPTPTPTPTTVLVRPALLDPVMGAIERVAVLRWKGRLGPGQSFVVRLRYLGGDRTWESGPLKTNCWEARLPAEWYGGWRWQVQVVQGTTVLAQSEEWDFWFDPFPRPGTPYPPVRSCSE